MTSTINYLIVHGTESSPEGNWFPWLKQQLETRSGKVYAPQFPTPEHQTLDNWLNVANNTLQNCAPENTTLIGHSTGAVMVLRMAQRTTTPFKAIYSVCPFTKDLGLPTYDPLNASFVHPAFDWQKTKQGAQKITCFAGYNDPYVPLPIAEDVARNLGISLHIIEKGGHLNAESGYRQFPLLLEKILEG